MSNYEVTQKVTHDGFHILKLIEGKFAGVEYSYSKVAFEEGEDDAKLVFDYEVYDGHQISEKMADEFSNTIGDILVQILKEQVEKNDVVYSGGV